MTATLASPRMFSTSVMSAVAFFFMWVLAMTVGLPQVMAAAKFFGVLPSPESANALIDCALWLAFAGLALYGLFSMLGMTHRTWTMRRREHLAEITFGGLGFGLLCLGLVHGGGAGVHPGAIHEALNLVRSAK